MRRHDLDVFSLVAGLVFGVVALGLMLDRVGAGHLDPRWVVPVLMVAVGVTILAGLLRGVRAEGGPGRGGPADHVADDHVADDRVADDRVADDRGDDDRGDTVVLDRGPAEAD